MVGSELILYMYMYMYMSLVTGKYQLNPYTYTFHHISCNYTCINTWKDMTLEDFTNPHTLHMYI